MYLNFNTSCLSFSGFTVNSLMEMTTKQECNTHYQDLNSFLLTKKKIQITDMWFNCYKISCNQQHIKAYTNMNSLLVLKHLFVIDENSSTVRKYQVKIWLSYSLSNVEVDKTHS